ncbi:ATP-binding protein [Amycolatopsis samaneae]|uniref:ATP-binding protein n=1 Tax=Amycolatopsis samaneae TaxID=664691 RepID=A0ABW5GX34_9PSEU
MDTSRIRIEVLGTPRVLMDGEPVAIRPRPLEVLAVVALSDSLFVGYPQLYGTFPKNKPSTVRAHVSDLRGQLGRAVVPADRGGVRLGVNRDQVDAVLFDVLLGRARGLPHDRRVPLLRQARDLWGPGKPFRERPDPLADRLDRLRRRRYAMYLDLIDSESHLGESDEAIADAERAAALWPTDEAVWSRLVDAVVAAGRAHEAEHHFARYQENAARERKKVSPDLRAKVRRATAGRRVPAADDLAGPYQLPRYDTVVRGRETDFARLDELLGSSPEAPGLAVVTGPPGVGKTALALKWANKVSGRFPGGNLHVDLAGFAGRTPVSPEEVLAGFLRTLRISPNGLTHDELVTAYRTALVGRSVLVVLDNAADRAQVEQLIAIGEASRTVITSRFALLVSDVGGPSCAIDLSPLPAAAGLQVLSDAIGDRRVRDEPGAAAEIVDRCSGLPLAIGLVAARARLWKSRRLRTIEAELEETGAILDVGAMRDRSGLRESFTWSYNALGADAAHVLHVVGLHPGPSVRPEVIAHLASLSRRDTSLALDELLADNLVYSAPDDRIALHDVIREFAVDTATQAAPDEAERVREKLLEYLLWSAVRCDQALDSGRDLPVGEPDDGAPVPAPATKEEAATWLAEEHEAYLAVLRSPAFARWPSYRWLLPAALCAYHNRAGHWATAEQLLCEALDVDKSDLGSERALYFQAVNLRLVCLIQRKLGKLDPAAQHARRSIRLCQEHGWSLDEAHARQQLCVVHEDAEQWDDALEQATAAQAIYTACDDYRGIAHTFNTMVGIDLNAGRPEHAVASGLKAAEATRRSTDAYGRASIHRNLQRAYEALEDWENAVDHGEAAAALYVADSPANEAHVLHSLLLAYRRLDRPEDERRAAARARDLLLDLPHRREQDKAVLAELNERLAG